ncbi:DNA-binding response regulator [Arthrobacter livingstonensis]|uniref:DNA-binding response regulator n=1 Tax=Arthrobacter livingstonensis TaxID=670078 RepID=A0A2V5L7S7_9MICC|nr:response regulator transcription factor [Arthrobacter livingstonensis]PYI66762.1 DNA-binding response regulator [Arthrobacter livingstonensis]
MIGVVIVDDQPLIRTGLRMIVESQADMFVAGEGGDGAGAVDLARTAAPDVMLLDIRMPGTGGIEAVAGVLAASGATRIIMLTTFDVEHYVYDSLRAGASGFLLKDVTPEHIIAGIRTVVGGDMLLAPGVTRRLVEQYVRRAPQPSGPGEELGRLTEREREVLAEIARGLSNAEIAGRLYVSEGTVKTHVSRLLAKLGLRDRVQAVIAAYELGFVEPGSGKSVP